VEVARYAAHGEMGGVFPPARRGRGDRLPTADAPFAILICADNGGDKDLGISDDWISDNVAIQTRSSDGVWEPSFPNYF